MTKKTFLLIVFTAIIGLEYAARAQAIEISYPETRTVDQFDNYHGTLVADPYRWLENLGSPEVNAWVEAQNALTFNYLENLPRRETLKNRLAKFVDFPRYRLPVHKGGRTFWIEMRGTGSRPALYVQGAPDAEPHILMQMLTLTENGPVAVGAHAVSPDGGFFVYGLQVAGSDWQTIHVRNVSTGEDLTDTLRWVKFSNITWTKDSKGFFYSRYDAPESDTLFARSTEHQLYYHRIGTPQSEDVLILRAEELPQTRLQTEITGDGRYLLIRQYTTPQWNRMFVLDLDDPMEPDLKAKLTPLFTDFDAWRELIGSRGSTAYILTNKNAPFKHIIAVNLENPAVENRTTIIPEATEARSVINGAILIGERFVVDYMETGKSSIRLYSLEGEPTGMIDLPGIGTVKAGPIMGGFRRGRDSTEMFYSFMTYLQPMTIYRYDFETGKSTIYRRPETPFDNSRYSTKQVLYESKDGTMVPMFIILRKDIKLNSDNPVIIYGYGGFGATVSPVFVPYVPMWLEMGGIWAFPDVRGGGAYGRVWHEAGILENKQNTFDDFIAAAEYLIQEGYTRSEKLGLMGNSMGGLLVGAVMTQRPELFAAALPGRGLFDLLRYHTFSGGQIGLSEFGSSDDPEMFPYIYAYSPLHNIEAGTCYPASLITTADHDNRVPPLHSYKFTAALQAAQGCANPVLLRVQKDAGHGAGTAMATRIAKLADVLAFAARHLGVER